MKVLTEIDKNMQSKKQIKNNASKKSIKSTKKINYGFLRSLIQKSQMIQLLKIIQQSPGWLITPKPSQNILKFACLANKSLVVSHLLQFYMKRIEISNLQQTSCLFDSLVECIRFQKFQMVQLFQKAGFDFNIVLFCKGKLIMTAIDFAIVGGHYEIAYFIYQKLDRQTKNLRNIKEYELIAKQYQYRYVNYRMIIEGLQNKIKNQEIGNYLKKNLSQSKKQQIQRIHNQGCWEWFQRVTKFNKQNRDKSKKIQPIIQSTSSKKACWGSLTHEIKIPHTQRPLNLKENPQY